MLQEAGYSSVKCIIRKVQENKKFVKTYNSEGYSEELIIDNFKDNMNEEEKEVSSEWLCVMAEK